MACGVRGGIGVTPLASLLQVLGSQAAAAAAAGGEQTEKGMVHLWWVCRENKPPPPPPPPPSIATILGLFSERDCLWFQAMRKG